MPSKKRNDADVNFVPHQLQSAKVAARHQKLEGCASEIKLGFDSFCYSWSILRRRQNESTVL
jgi:hypothetical protein